MAVIKSSKQANKVLVNTPREACEVDISKINCLTLTNDEVHLVIESTGLPDLYIHYPEGSDGVEAAADMKALAELRLAYLDGTANTVYSGESESAESAAEPYYLLQTPTVYGEVLLNNINSVEKHENGHLVVGYLIPGEASGNSFFYQVGLEHLEDTFRALRNVVFAEYPGLDA